MAFFIYLFFVCTVTVQSIDCVVHNVYWRNYAYGDIPCDAVQAAPGRFIGQFNTNETDLVGTIYTDTGLAVGISGSKISVDRDIRILCSPDHARLYWEHVDLNKAQEQQLQDAVKGGYTNANHYPIFIGKAIHEEEWKIGKVLGYQYTTHRGLWVWDQNEAKFNIRQFLILKYNVTDKCAQQCSTVVKLS